MGAESTQMLQGWWEMASYTNFVLLSKQVQVVGWFSFRFRKHDAWVEGLIYMTYPSEAAILSFRILQQCLS
jgi:hypothetical protein